MHKELEEIIAKLVTEEMEHLEAFTCAYIKMTGILPGDAVLVKVQEMKDKVLTTKWFFRKKTEEERTS